MLPLFYFGPISYWKHLSSQEGELSFSVGSSIPKKSYANRTRILTANGLLDLSIPLKGGRGVRDPYFEIKICYEENWVSKHQMALQSAYGKSPFFEYYKDRLFSILDQKDDFLHLLNIRLSQEVANILKLEKELVLVKSHTSNANWLEFHPSTPKTMSPYPQVFRSKYTFTSDLSILDLIFNQGTRAKEYLIQASD